MIFGGRKYDWELIDKTIIPSIEETRAQIAREDGRHYDGDSHYSVGKWLGVTLRPPDESLQQTLVLTFKCRKTNKIKVVIHKNGKLK